MKKVLMYLSILVIGTVFLVGCGNGKELIDYESELLGIDFSAYAVKGSGSVTKSDEAEDYANIVLELDASKIDEIKTTLNKKISPSISQSDRSKYIGASILEKVNEECPDNNIVEMYHKMFAGKKAKTREIVAALCYKNNKYYLNIIG